MVHLAAATDPPAVSTRRRLLGLGYAAILAVMALLQLFHFEEFLVIIQSYNIWNSPGDAALFATGIVVMEIFALPYLLRMRLSVAFRALSVIFSVVVPILWLYAVVLLFGTATPTGLLGDKIVVYATGWSLTYAIILLAVAIKAAWALGVFTFRSQK